MRPSSTEEAGGSIRSRWIGAAFLLGLTLCMFGDVLFTSKPIVLSDGRGRSRLTIHLLARVCCGSTSPRPSAVVESACVLRNAVPGRAQAGVLYPPNWLDLVLPLPRSINLAIALHVFLAGLFTYVWGLRRGLHPVAAVTAGALFMFSGAYFLHLYAGHLSCLRHRLDAVGVRCRGRMDPDP